jgi:hypothetical protein
MAGYVRFRYGDGHDAARQQALAAWSKAKP